MDETAIRKEGNAILFGLRLMSEEEQKIAYAMLEGMRLQQTLPEWIAYFGNRPRKVGATEYWDDRAVKMLVDYGDTSAHQVKNIINIVEIGYLICPSKQSRKCLEVLYELSARLMKEGGS